MRCRDQASYSDEHAIACNHGWIVWEERIGLALIPHDPNACDRWTVRLSFNSSLEFHTSSCLMVC
jgi:hypothetical protein